MSAVGAPDDPGPVTVHRLADAVAVPAGALDPPDPAVGRWLGLLHEEMRATLGAAHTLVLYTGLSVEDATEVLAWVKADPHDDHADPGDPFGAAAAAIGHARDFEAALHAFGPLCWAL